uniref:Uncharacterized protein n=1 Tax=Timema shepardi TaxID=629360 RepID=A0A7R9ANI8_TIMSH|nr:unnamed protein product [Timema shepardi]
MIWLNLQLDPSLFQSDCHRGGTSCGTDTAVSSSTSPPSSSLHCNCKHSKNYFYFYKKHGTHFYGGSECGIYSPYTHTDMIPTPITPDIVGHLESNDEDSKVQFSGPFSKSMCPQELVQPPFGRVVIRGIVVVGSFPFTHLAADCGIKKKENDFSPGSEGQYRLVEQDLTKAKANLSQPIVNN